MNTTPPNFPISGAPTQQTQWPRVLGTIAVVFGSCGALAGLCGLASVFAMGPFTKLMEKFTPATAGEPTLEQTFAAMQKFAAWNIATNIFAVLVAVLLIVGGARLIKRRAKCRATILCWCGLKFVVAVITLILGYFIGQEQSALKGSDDQQAAMVVSAMEQGGAIVIQALTFLWLIALPVFMVIWFNRPRIRSEVARWI